jgi:hypothetical protein
MRRNQLLVLGLAFAVALLAIGVPYWQIPYAKVALPNSIVGFGLFVSFVAAAMVRYLGRVPFRHALLAVGLAAPCAVLLRIIVGVSGDPTSHNLWPIELFLACVVGFGTSLCGTLLGSGLLLFLGRNKAAEERGA